MLIDFVMQQFCSVMCYSKLNVMEKSGISFYHSLHSQDALYRLSLNSKEASQIECGHGYFRIDDNWYHCIDEILSVNFYMFHTKYRIYTLKDVWLFAKWRFKSFPVYLLVCLFCFVTFVCLVVFFYCLFVCLFVFLLLLFSETSVQQEIAGPWEFRNN